MSSCLLIYGRPRFFCHYYFSSSKKANDQGHRHQKPMMSWQKRSFALKWQIGMKCVVHEEKRSQILLNTSSPGIALTLPERSSERRRLATAAHLRSMSNAGGFRLLRMESTTIALSSTGSEIASAIKSFVFKLVRLRVLF